MIEADPKGEKAKDTKPKLYKTFSRSSKLPTKRSLANSNDKLKNQTSADLQTSKGVTSYPIVKGFMSQNDQLLFLTK
jgi:hypothetical protein